MNVERLPVRHHERVAVLLNANAGAVTDRLRRELENFVPPEDIFYSRTIEDARGIARTVLERGYATVLTGGGDGTFVAYVNCLFEEASQSQVMVSGGGAVQLARHRFRIPRVGVLKLGTGNAVVEFCWSPARQIGPDGKPLGRDIARGEVIYRGPCRLAAAGSVPCYGFGFQMFPFARRLPGRFQLRISAMSLPKMLAQFPRIWHGHTPRSGVLDFHCDEVRKIG